MASLSQQSYRIYFAIRREIFSFHNNQKKFDPICKTDLDFWDRLGGEKYI